MSPFDLVVRNGEVAIAADIFRADIGIRAGRITALGESLERGAEEIDAAGLIITGPCRRPLGGRMRKG